MSTIKEKQHSKKSNLGNTQNVSANQNVVPIDFDTRCFMVLVFLWDCSPFQAVGGQIQTKQISCSGSAKCERGKYCEDMEGRGIADTKGGRTSDSVSNTQSYLPCKSAFINATFVGKIIGKEKAKYTSC